MANKKRLDVMLVEKGLFPSREKAKSAIMAGLINIDGRLVDKAGTEISVDSQIEVTGPANPYVSRGGLKLKKALDEFGISLAGKVVADIGASTGGFTDCVLQHGAVKVYAIDVGYGQLDWKLRQDPRVVNLERTNIRYFDPGLLNETPDLVTVDVAFISLEKVLPKISEILEPGGLLVTLIKPQFEAGRQQVGKKGVVRDPDIHIEVIDRIIAFAAGCGIDTVHLTYSPIKGPEGNIEYLALMRRSEGITQKPVPGENLIRSVVSAAFCEL
ncbi:MAG: TlyA family rRNA (cytidine-2'-O)-methyltransferase [Firmicutes bacterium HGW-Firmicutes-14]|nr:MAG: TlyA family rRNA (cytidine-2'-O)-methyltransferase [Firmicutes bacterium HGW-Firmicutes-14]